jgi:hypothetical protein
MTTLVGTLTWSGLLPSECSMSTTLTCSTLGRTDHRAGRRLVVKRILFPIHIPPKACEIHEWGRADAKRTLRRYFDPSLPSAEVKPTNISKASSLGLYSLTLGEHRSTACAHGSDNGIPITSFPHRCWTIYTTVGIACLYSSH